MMVDIDKLKEDIINLPSRVISQEFKNDLSYFSGTLNRQLEILDLLDKYKEDDQIPFYDEEEIVENCTVQILSNSKTGDVSVGWWRNS